MSNFTDADPVHIYVDLDITNSNFDGTLQPRPVVFNEIRNTPYILQPSKYFFSVVRFELQTQTLPVFIPLISPNPDTQHHANDINHTPYQIGIVYRGQEYIKNIEFVSQINVRLNPSPPTSTVLPTDRYYYCYTYQQFLNCVNNALKDLCGEFSPVITAHPVFYFDESTYRIKFSGLASIWNSGTTSNATVDTAVIYMNEPLYNLFSGFDFIDNERPAINPTINPLQYRMKIYYTFGNALTDPLGGNASVYNIVMTSEQIDVAVWNPIKSIVFTSGLIPLLPTLSGPPKSLETSGGTYSSYGNNSNLSTQMTDFEVGFSASNTYKQTVNYQPASEYRLIDIQSDLPISSIQVSVFWKNANGILTPFYLDGGQNGNIKLMFRRKDFNSIEY
jgi:hypothetical protein